MNDFLNPRGDAATPHYYGNRVRVLFLIIAVILLGAVLVDVELLSFNLIFGVALVFILTALAGFTSPSGAIVITADLAVSGLIFVVYEYLAIGAFASARNFFDPAFVTRELIALVSLTSLYYSIKSYRGMRDRRTPTL